MSLKSQTFRDKPFRITNSMGHKKVEFCPLAAPRVLFYSCGPTVYGPLHIGNARALVVADLFFRWLKHIGYDVNYVRNFTDVDDKIIRRGAEEKKDPAAVAQFYLEYAQEDMRLLDLAIPTKECRVTESMDDIIAMVGALQKNGYAYDVNGEVLYSVEKKAGYGKLSGKNIDDLIAGARVEVAPYKKNPMDFSLWKSHKPGEPHWESPWGQGRPGWHIECSAMAKRWLGDTIDLHHGGQDLIFPHHENEIAQSEGATGKEFCAHWVHNAFLTTGREKMSKSLGNIFEIRKFIETYGAEVLRYEFVKHHYRTPFDFNEQTLAETLMELERIYAAKAWAEEAMSAAPIIGADGSAFTPLGDVSGVWRAVEDELFNDLNTAGAVSQIFIHVRALNAAEGKSAGHAGRKALPSFERQVAAHGLLLLLSQGAKPLLNVFGEDAAAMLTHIGKVRATLHAAQCGGAVLSDADIERLLLERKEARARKDFARGDAIRKELADAGVQILDSSSATTWKRV